jgi:ADP-ribosylglycohydrolase
MPGWTNLENLINLEKAQLIEEGVAPEVATDAAKQAHDKRLSNSNEYEVWAPFKNLPIRDDFPFVEPSDLEAIRAQRSGDAPKLSFTPSDEVLMDKMYGAWLARCAGCALGKPVEGFMRDHNGIRSWERQKTFLQAIDASEWPLKDYFPQRSPAQEKTAPTGSPHSTREQIAFMETDDDIRYTIIGQIVLSKAGRNFCSTDVCRTWLHFLSYDLVCTAETQAYRNLINSETDFTDRAWRISPAKIDATADWHHITHHLNPYREWIGAQIRIDSYGYAAAGDPELAAEFAWRDARISHVKNGLYGAMFCAAMIAAAFATDDPMTIIRAGLAQIPKQSRLHAEMLQTVDICKRYNNDFARFEDVFKDIYALLGHYDPVHTNNNCALCVAALLLGNCDFHKGITLAVMGGLDTDCNGATVGSIVGAVCGAKKAPQHWTGRLNDTLNSFVIDYHPIAISECAKRSVGIWKKVRDEKPA